MRSGCDGIFLECIPELPFLLFGQRGRDFDLKTPSFNTQHLALADRFLERPRLARRLPCGDFNLVSCSQLKVGEIELEEDSPSRPPLLRVCVEQLKLLTGLLAVSVLESKVCTVGCHLVVAS